MVKIYESRFGFKYAMEESTYLKLLTTDSLKSPGPLDNAESYIKISKGTAGFISLLAFIFISTMTNYWLFTGLGMIILSFIGVALSYSLTFLKLFKWVLIIYDLINKFFIKYILVALFSWFYLENWIMVIVFIVASIICNFINLWFSSVGCRAKFNSKIAEHALNNRLL